MFRAVQGLSAGVGLIVGRAVIRDVLHGDDAQRLMSQVSMIFGIAPAIAPVIGGWILGWSHWPMIFWFLVAFSVALAIATWRALPETLPPADRLSPRPRELLRGYAGIFVNPRFQRLAAAGTFNFGALFLYIASAPAFVLDILGLGQDAFAWFFVPMIGGMMAAGKLGASRRLYDTSYANSPFPVESYAGLPMDLATTAIGLGAIVYAYAHKDEGALEQSKERGAVLVEQLDAATRNGFVLAPETVKEIGRAEAEAIYEQGAGLFANFVPKVISVGHTDESSPIVTLPMTTADGWTNTLAPNIGAMPLYVSMVMQPGPTASATARWSACAHETPRTPPSHPGCHPAPGSTPPRGDRRCPARGRA